MTTAEVPAWARRSRWDNVSMSRVPVLDALETDRLILRHRRADEAAIYRQLWTERDPRVPPHRQIDPEGRPTVEDIAAQIRAEREESALDFWRWSERARQTSLGTAGLILHGNGSPDEPELAYELLRAAHGCGYATEAGRAVVSWASGAGEPGGCGLGSGLECRIATSPGKARVPRNGPGRARRCPRRQPANRTRVLICARVALSDLRNTSESRARWWPMIGAVHRWVLLYCPGLATAGDGRSGARQGDALRLLVPPQRPWLA